MPACRANRRTLGKQRPAWSAKLTRHCRAQRRRGFSGRYRSKVTGTKESKRASGVAAQPARKRLAWSALRLRQEMGLAKIGELGEARSCPTSSFPALAGYADPPPRRVLRF